MASLELIGIILTFSVSVADLILNSIALCMSGKCSISLCGGSIEHTDTESQAIETIRRMSNCPPPIQQE